MSTAITETPDPERWQTPQEQAPSVLAQDVATGARVIGFFGLLFFVLGVVAIGFDQAGSRRYIGGDVGSLLVLFGVGGLLYHAARDSELQIRRAYGGLAVLLLVAAIVAAVYPAVPTGAVGVTPAEPVMGARFLPWGAVSLIVSLLFFLPTIRNETEEKWQRAGIVLLGAAGLLLMAVGLIGGNVSKIFLLPYGLILALLGLAYLWAFISFIGSDSDLGQRTGLVVGAAGCVVLLVAVARSVLAYKGWLGIGRDPSYLAAAGIVLGMVGLLYAVTAYLLVSERVTAVLTRRELASFFFSPIAYFILIGFAVMGWVSYLLFVNNAVEATRARQPLIEPIIIYYFFNIIPVICFIAAIPILTMWLFSEEYRSQTLEVLMTAPVDEVSVVLAKFWAVLIMFILTWLPFELYLVALRMESGQAFDYRPLISFSIGMICSGAGCLSVGLFISSLTRSQVAAIAFTFMAMVLLTFVYFIKESLLSPGGPLQDVLTYFSYIHLWRTTLEGKLALSDITFNIAVTVFWLYLTVKVLESRKWL